MTKTFGMLVAGICFLVQVIGQTLVVHGRWQYEDYAMAGVFFGIAFYTQEFRRRVLSLILAGVTFLYHFLPWDSWWLLGVWFGIILVALCWFRWQDTHKPGVEDRAIARVS